MILLYALLFWFVYLVVTRFLIPVYRTSKELKKQFNNIKDQFQTNTDKPANGATSPKQPPEKTGEYIEFEEVKN